MIQKGKLEETTAGGGQQTYVALTGTIEHQALKKIA
jgi:hypothetical protein